MKGWNCSAKCPAPTISTGRPTSSTVPTSLVPANSLVEQEARGHRGPLEPAVQAPVTGPAPEHDGSPVRQDDARPGVGETLGPSLQDRPRRHVEPVLLRPGVGEEGSRGRSGSARRAPTVATRRGSGRGCHRGTGSRRGTPPVRPEPERHAAGHSSSTPTLPGRSISRFRRPPRPTLAHRGQGRGANRRDESRGQLRLVAWMRRARPASSIRSWFARLDQRSAPRHRSHDATGAAHPR
jgi:hypothetical protein